MEAEVNKGEEARVPESVSFVSSFSFLRRSYISWFFDFTVLYMLFLSPSISGEMSILNS